MYNLTTSKMLSALLLTTLLSACGSDPTDPPAATELSLELDGIKTFRFSWQPADGATHYQLSEDPDGKEGTNDWTVLAELPAATLSYNLEVPLYARAKAQYLLSSCNSGGCTDGQAVLIDGDTMLDHLVKSIGYLKATNTGKGDQFGTSVSLNKTGRVLAVGAPYESGAENTLVYSGAVYLFSQNAQGQWQSPTLIKAKNAASGDNFGSSVSLNDAGNVLAVGARFKNQLGAVYLFSQEDDGSWTEQTSVTGSESEPGGQFGVSVSLNKDGTVLAVGNGSESGSIGKVYIFVRENGPANWPEQDVLSASNGENGDLFASSVSLSDDGTVLAVGAWGEANLVKGVPADQPTPNTDNNDAPSSGAVYLFGKGEDNQWSQQAYLKASNAEAYDYFGYSVSLNQDGTVLAVGALGEANSAKGASADQPTPDTDNSDAPNSGAVYLFGREGNTWVQNAYIKASNTGQRDSFGVVSLSDDGQRLVVAAYSEGNKATGLNGDDGNDELLNAGAAYSYLYRDGTWQFESYIKASNTGALDFFGTALSLSGDGQTLAVSAGYEDSNGKGVGGDELAEGEPEHEAGYNPQTNNDMESSGAVYLY